jgi:hypothetical protein
MSYIFWDVQTASTVGQAALIFSPFGGDFWRIFRLHEPMKYLETCKKIRPEGLQDYLAILQSVLIIFQVLPWDLQHFLGIP